jgi:general secretion pathway protein B
MSLILDALNRADRERGAEHKETFLGDVNSPSYPRVNPVKRWIVEALLVIIVIVVAIFALSEMRENRLSTENPELNSTIVGSTSSDILAPTPNTDLSIPAVKLELSAGLSSLKDASSIAHNKPLMVRSDNPSIGALYNESVDENSTETIVTKTMTEYSKSAADKPVDNTQSILESIPTLSHFSPQFRNAIPNIEYSVHVYAENAGFVVLNGEKYKTGNQIAADLRVIAILKDSVVLDFQGKQFRLTALNSWVNYR